MIDYVRGRGVATSTAEPFATCQASNDGAWVVYTAVSGVKKIISSRIEANLDS